MLKHLFKCTVFPWMHNSINLSKDSNDLGQNTLRFWPYHSKFNDRNPKEQYHHLHFYFALFPKNSLPHIFTYTNSYIFTIKELPALRYIFSPWELLLPLVYSVFPKSEPTLRFNRLSVVRLASCVVRKCFIQRNTPKKKFSVKPIAVEYKQGSLFIFKTM